MEICGNVSTMDAWFRSMPLCTSDCEPRRMTTTLSYEPVSISVFWSPSASMRVAAKTKTTRAMPDVVSAVVSRRVQRLRKL